MGFRAQARTALTTIATATLLGVYVGSAVRLDALTRPGAPARLEASAAGRTLGDGMASHYGAELSGLPTASGERYDPELWTAAHRTLPLGSRVRVTSLETGRSTVVRINDRGPFVGNRVIDLSQAAARDLGMLPAGSARVELQLLDR